MCSHSSGAWQQLLAVPRLAAWPCQQPREGGARQPAPAGEAGRVGLQVAAGDVGLQAFAGAPERSVRHSGALSGSSAGPRPALTLVTCRRRPALAWLA